MNTLPEKESSAVGNSPTKTKLKIYHFVNTSIDADIINDKGKVVCYKDVFSISDTAENAKIRSKLSEDYVLHSEEELGDGWYA